MRIKAITELTLLATKQKLHSLGNGRICILNFGLIAKPLYEAAKRPDAKPITWRKEHDQAFYKIKQALVEAPALDIPNLSLSFYMEQRSNE